MISRNRFRVAIGLVVVVALAVVISVTSAGAKNAHPGGGWLGQATGAGHTTSQSRATSGLRLVFVVKNLLTNAGSSGGFDEIAVYGPLRKDGATVGFGIVRCGLETSIVGECTGTFNVGGSFPNGSQITIQGFNSAATHWFNAITGGTGRYAHASGEVEASNIPNTSNILLIFHLRR